MLITAVRLSGCRVLPMGAPATGRERRGKRLVFEILFVITTTVIDWYYSGFIFMVSILIVFCSSLTPFA